MFSGYSTDYAIPYTNIKWIAPFINKQEMNIYINIVGIQIQATFVKIIQIIIIFYKGFYWPFINFVIILFLVIIDHPLFISRFIGNSLWLIALIYYIYISFLGYSGKLIEVSSEKLKFKKVSFVDFFPAPAHKLIFHIVKSMKKSLEMGFWGP